MKILGMLQGIFSIKESEMFDFIQNWLGSSFENVY